MPFCEGGRNNLSKSLFVCLFVLAIDFNVANILKNPRAHTTSVLKEESTASKVAVKVWPVLQELSLFGLRCR